MPLSARWFSGFAAALVVSLCSCAQASPPATAVVSGPAPAFDDAFWKAWGDGKAELAGYDLMIPRYGQIRHGTAVAIFVTETFSDSLRVKSDPGRHSKSDEFPVMKLNLVQDFPTGIYDYNLMTSAFVALTGRNGRPAGAPTKVSFSSQEWCGNVYAQARFDAGAARMVSHSYFDGEADRDESLPVANDAASEDALLLWARGLAWPRIAPGESRSVRLLRSLRTARLLHKAAGVRMARFTRADSVSVIRVPAGSFATRLASVEIDDGPVWSFWVERAAPGRVIKWACSDGEVGELLASDRLEYWKLHDLGGEAMLAKLGLTPRARRTP